jgi:hypothetical protein
MCFVVMPDCDGSRVSKKINKWNDFNVQFPQNVFIFSVFILFYLIS